MLDEPTNHLDIERDRVARGAPAPAVRCAARGLARPRVPRRDRDPRLGAARPAAHGVPRRLQRVPPPARRARRPRREGRRHQQDAIEREQSSWSSATAASASTSKMHEHEAPSREAQGRDGRGAAASPAAAPAARRRRSAAGRRERARSSSAWRTSRSGTCRAAGAPPRWHGRRRAARSRAAVLAAQRGERIGIVGPNGAGKTTLLRTIAGDLPPLDGTIGVRAQRSQLGYLAQLAAAPIPGATVLDALLAAIPVTPARRASTWPASCSAATTCSRRSGCCPAASGRGWSSRCWASCPRTCCCSTSPPTTSTSRPARRSRRSSRVAGHAARRVPRPAAARDGLRAAVGRGRRRWRSPFDGGYRAWRAAVADGWTVEGEVARRAAAAGSRAAGRVHRPTRRRRRRRSRSAASAGDEPASPRGHGDRSTHEAGPKLSKDAYRRRREAPRRRADPPRAAQEPAGARDGRPLGRGQLRRDAPGHERARRRGAALAEAEDAWLDARGARPVTPAPADGPDRHHRARSAAASRRSPAGWGARARWSSTPTASRATSRPRARRTHAADPARGSGTRRRRPTGRSTGRRSARIVFADPRALRDLEAIVHPAVRPRILAAIEAAEADGHPAVVIEAIKLVEGGLAGLCDEVWLVTCDPDAQLRAAARPAACRRTMRASGSTRRTGSTTGSVRRPPGSSTRRAPRTRPGRGVDAALDAAIAARGPEPGHSRRPAGTGPTGRGGRAGLSDARSGEQGVSRRARPTGRAPGPARRTAAG